MELAIDTCTATASLALSQEGRVIVELSWHCPQNHTAELLPYLDFLLGRASAGLSGLTLIGVARGPGSFNGIRVGLATAQGLAMALGLPLLGVSTLEALAYAGRGLGRSLCPLLPAGRGMVAAALFRESRGRWQRLQEEHLTTPEELAQALPGPVLFCGEISPEVKAELRGWLGRRARFLPVGGRAGLVAALCWERGQRGERDDSTILQPLYLRPPSITMPKEATVGGAG